MDTIRLLKAEDRDADALIRILKICFQPHWERYHDENNPVNTTAERMSRKIQSHAYFKIFFGNHLAGLIEIIRLNDQGSYKLDTVCILPEYQNHGIGQAAIRLSEAMFPDAVEWTLQTLEDMPENRHVYENLGYQDTGEREKINEKLTLVFYRKTV